MRASEQVERLEARLRKRGEEVAQLKRDLDKAQASLAVCDPPPPAPPAVLPERLAAALLTSMDGGHTASNAAHLDEIRIAYLEARADGLKSEGEVAAEWGDMVATAMAERDAAERARDEALERAEEARGLSLKRGVRLCGLRPEMLIAVQAALAAYWPHEVVITSANDSTHSRTSLHWSGAAIDLRTRHLPDEDRKRKIAEELRARLGSDFDVVLESDHLHVEYQPKARAS